MYLINIIGVLNKEKEEKPTYQYHISSGNFSWPLCCIKRWPHKWINLTIPVLVQDVDTVVLMRTQAYSVTSPDQITSWPHK